MYVRTVPGLEKQPYNYVNFWTSLIPNISLHALKPHSSEIRAAHPTWKKKKLSAPSRASGLGVCLARRSLLVRLPRLQIPDFFPFHIQT